jgi:putative sigma-54 modulation protein
MYAAIDALVDKLDRQIIKRKEKITNHHRSEGSPKKAQL